MRFSRRGLIVIVVVAALVAGMVFVDQFIRNRVERSISQTVATEFGGQVTTELGGWPFLASQLTNRIEDARITVLDVTLPVEDRWATIDRAELTVVGLSPINDLEHARVERLDARVLMSWGHLTTLLGFPVGHVEGDRISARTSVEVFGVVAVAELQAVLSVEPDGRLVLSDATATAAGVDLPRQLVQPVVDLLAPTMQLPQLNGLSYQGLEIDSTGIAALLYGTDVGLNELA